MPPSEAGPLRTAEQVAAAAAVGVSVVEFLDHADGLVVNGLELRRDLAAAIRRHRPEVIIGSNFRDRWGDSGPWNQVDHRVRWIAFASSPVPTHGVDVTDHIGEGVDSLVCHGTYIDSLGDEAFDPDSFLRDSCHQVGETLGVQFGVAFELIPA